MEYILKNTDIFDEAIAEKLSKAMDANKDSFTKENTYKFTVSFHVNLLDDARFEEFHVPFPSKTNKGTRKDKIYDVMGLQLRRLEQVLDQYGIGTFSTTIQGDYLEEESIIKVEIIEDTDEPKWIGRGKKKSRIKVSSIVPSMPYTRKNVTKLASERISKLFYELMNIIQDKKLMSEILEIEETKDNNVLFKAFAEQYGELWLAMNSRAEELMNKLKERSLFVVNKYIDKENVTF